MKLIASLATIPSRIGHLRPVLMSIAEQTLPPDEIHIQIPRFCVKEQSSYLLPGFLEDHERVRLKTQPTDFGASNKWLYPIHYLRERTEAQLIVVDDDCCYPPDCFELLVKRVKANRHRCYGFTGGVFPRYPQRVAGFTVSNLPVHSHLTIISDNRSDIPVDTVQGFSTFTLFPYLFKDFDFALFSEVSALMHSDDVLISGLMEFLRIPRVQIGPYQTPDELPHACVGSLSSDAKRFLAMTLNALGFVKQRLGVWPDVWL